MSNPTPPTPPTASELLAEWKYANEFWLVFTQDEAKERDEAKKSLAAQLDQKAGISIVDGSFNYRRMFKKHVMALESTKPYYKYCKIDAQTQQALQEWLLIKNV